MLLGACRPKILLQAALPKIRVLRSRNMLSGLNDGRILKMPSFLWLAIGIAAFALVAAVPAQAAEDLHRPGIFGPMYYLRTFGSPGHEIRQILLALTWLSIAVVVIMTALVVMGVMRRARWVQDMSADASSVRRGQDKMALRWISAGLVVTVVILFFFITWTVSTMAGIQSPASASAATIEVTGHQWWWEVAYKGDNGATLFETANEIRVPVGRPVRFVLRSADVIHSFWVPLLAGKTDLIPGQENVTWLRADTAGVYRGQCLEFCGLQHAHMSFQLVAVPPKEFDAWLAQQAEPAQNRAGASSGTGDSAPTEVPTATPASRDGRMR